MGARKALVVALNNYPNPQNFLPSCINDAHAIVGVLRDVYGFTEIQSLFDSDATLDNVALGLDQLFADAQPDDRLVFYFSGHGYYVRTGNDIEEVICLYDKFLFDNVLIAKSQDVPPGVLTVISDSCHSGGLTKQFAIERVAAGKPKFLQVPPSGAPLKGFLDESELRKLRYRPFGARRRSMGAVGKAFGSFTKDFDERGQLDLNGMLFAACLATETASASTVQTDGKSAFTYALLNRLARMGSSASNNALLDEAIRELGSLGFRQTPVLFEPASPPGLGAKSFVLFGRAQDGGALEDKSQQSIQQLVDNLFNRKEFAMSSYTGHQIAGNGSAAVQGQDKFLGLVTTIASAAIPMIIDAVRKGGVEPQKDFANQEGRDKFWGDLAGVVASALPDVVRALTKSGTGQDKSILPIDDRFWPAITGPIGGCIPRLMIEARRAGIEPQKAFNDGGEKFWGLIGGVVASALPGVISALTKSGVSLDKNFQPGVDGQDKFIGSLVPLLPTLIPAVVQALSKSGYAPQKDYNSGEEKFWGTAFRAVASLAPVVIQALSKGGFEQQKAFADDKGFWDSLGNVVREALPIIARELTKEPAKGFEPGVVPAVGDADPKFWTAVARVVAAAIPTIVDELTKAPAVPAGKGMSILSHPSLTPEIMSQLIASTMPAASSAWQARL